MIPDRKVIGNGVNATMTHNDTTGRVTLQGRILAKEAQPMKIKWRAAAPATRGLGSRGAFQPYPNRHMAFDGTPNVGQTQSRDGTFTIELQGMPAGYYSGLGAMYVPPTVELYITGDADKQTIKLLLALEEPTMLPVANTSESTGRAMYYADKVGGPIFLTQEARLRAQAGTT